MTTKSSVRIAFDRGIAALLCIATITIGGRLHAAPADVFSSPAPAVGADPPKAAERRTGDSSVSTQNGALSYSYPISVPPGRGGMAPSLALTYSSQAPIYGGIASGWSLPIPMILEDTSQGRLRTHSGEVEVQQGTAGPDDDRFISTMAGSRPLVRVQDYAITNVTSYRAQGDATYTRYQKLLTGSVAWRAYTTAGHVLTFGDTSPGRAECPNVGHGFAPLTSQVDSFGNEVVYTWQWQATLGECRISEITWGMNANAGITKPFARVFFEYGGETQYQGFWVGSRVDYRTGTKMVSGASKLQTINITAFAPVEGSAVEHTRVITLGYDGTAELANGHAPQRALTSIQESAWRGLNENRVDLPAVTFQYEPPAVTLQADRTAPTPWTDPGHGTMASPNNLGWGWRFTDGRWPTVEQMFVDLDGDGLLDRLTNTSSVTGSAPYQNCTATWQRNLGLDGTGKLVFGTGGNITLPRLKWGSGSPTATPNTAGTAARRDPSLSSSSWEDCSLNAQMTTYWNSNPAPASSCHDGNSCYSTNGRQFCAPGGTKCGPDEAGLGNGDYRTYLAYRWLDVDGDGLTDLVAAIHGSIDRYDVERGNLPDPASGMHEPPPFGLGTWPACPGTQVDQCRDVGTLLDGARNCDHAGLCTYRWDVINDVLNSSPAVSCFKIMARPAGGGSGLPATQAPYTRCEGLYPWFVFRNQGNQASGLFATTPEVKYQPVPLESDSGDSSLYSSSLMAQNHGVFDFDGDGTLDGVVHGKEVQGGNPDGWYVWLGDGTGGMGTKRYFVPTRKAHTALSQFQTSDAQNRISAAIDTTGTAHSLHVGTVDLNGDGLPDHYLVATNTQPSPTFTNVAMNDGTTYELLTSTQLGEIDTPNGVFPTTESRGIPQFNQFNVMSGGDSDLTNRLTDIDHDGRLDILRWDAGGTPTLFYNLGGQFLTPASSYPSAAGAAVAARRHVKLSQLGAGLGVDSLKWEFTSDVLDLDGDGISEGLRASAGNLTTNVPFTTTTPVKPPRLLKQINNGRGLHTSITYAPMHEDALTGAQTVTQSPSSFWWDGRPKATPATLWVTKSIRVEDDFNLPGQGTVTSYKYANPRHGKDDQGQYGFRGFETVTTTAHSGAKTVETFDYHDDWSGRLVKSVVYSVEAPTSPVTVDTTKYTPMSDLLGGAITVVNPTLREHFVCADSSTESACSVASTAVYYTRTESTFTPKASNTAPDIALMHVESSVRLQHHEASGAKDRVSLTSYFLAADGSTYRLRPTISESQEQQPNGSMTTFAKSETTWDPSTPAFARKSSDKVWFDANTVSTTNYSYEGSTGNLLSVTSPRGNTTSYEYDSRKLFVAFDNSPYYTHDVEYTYEYGTGVNLETRGPNTAPCAIPQWPTCSTNIYRQTSRVVVDGLGRPLETWGTVDIDPYTYDLRKIGIATYVDTAPASVTTQSALKQDPVSGAISYAAGKTFYDGHGRPTRVEQWANGSLGPSSSTDNVTTYAYRLDGTLQTVSIQKPNATTAVLVPYTYTFDSLGRPTGVTRPDSGSTGASVTYGSAVGAGIDVGTGVYTDTVENAESAAKRAELRRTLDADGRLIKLEEKTEQNGSGDASAWATTYYEYDAAGNVSKITDADGKITTLAHDWAGHRLSIDRGNSRKWEYRYDLAGNVTSEVSPHTTACEQDPACKLRFTTAIAYDLLDRASVKAIAPRDLSNEDLDLFGAVQELYRYDWGSLTGSNDRGHLNQWHALGLNSTVRSNEIASYDAQGNRLVKWLAFNSAGYDKFRWTANDRYLSGAVKRTHYNEGVNGGSVESVADFDYDARGLPSTVKISVDGGTTFGPAVTDTRNIAGLVTKRRADYPASPTPPMTFIESAWTYDVLGRVLTQTVNKGTPATTQVAKQTLTYFGNDDVNTLRTDLGATTGQTQTFTFDYRHQLTGVAAGTGFGGTYDYNVAGRLKQAQITRSSGRPNNDIVPRNVFYNYASTDPELVTSLNSSSFTGPAFMTFTYDLAGNQLTKVEASTGNKWEYLYDGSDRLRRATKKTSANVVVGSEEYWYDWDGNRSHVVTRNGSGAITEMVWFQDGVEAHYSAPGAGAAVTFAYAHAPMVRVKRTSDTATTTEYQFHGLASNLLAGVSSTGTNNVIFNYAPFGEVIEAQQATGMLAQHKRRLNDKQQDDLTGLFYYGARYYDRTLMGWTQVDPLYLRVPDLAKQSTPRRSNLGVFSLNNPVRYLDPDGRDSAATWSAPSGVNNVCNTSETGQCTMDGGAPVYDGEKAWLANNTERDKAKRATEQRIVAHEAGHGSAKHGSDTRHFPPRLAYGVQTLIRPDLGEVLWSDHSHIETNQDLLSHVVDQFGASAPYAAATAVGAMTAALSIRYLGLGGIGGVGTIGALIPNGSAGAAEGMVLVSRWGKNGSLDVGDWVMKGGPPWVNYILSGKWQPGFGNQFASRSQFQTFVVNASRLVTPYEEGWLLGVVKGILGQRQVGQ